MNADGPRRLWAGLLPRLRLKRGREEVRSGREEWKNWIWKLQSKCPSKAPGPQDES